MSYIQYNDYFHSVTTSCIFLFNECKMHDESATYVFNNVPVDFYSLKG